MVNFEIVHPDDLSREAYNYLVKAADSFGGSLYVAELAQKWTDGQILFINIKLATLLRGAFVLVFSQQQTSMVMSLVLLGGEGLDEWGTELAKYLYWLAKKHAVDEFIYMGRKGFARHFPELQECARVYRLILKPANENIN